MHIFVNLLFLLVTFAGVVYGQSRSTSPTSTSGPTPPPIVSTTIIIPSSTLTFPSPSSPAPPVPSSTIQVPSSSPVVISSSSPILPSVSVSSTSESSVLSPINTLSSSNAVVIVSLTASNGLARPTLSSQTTLISPTPTSSTETITAAAPSGLGAAAITGIIIAALALMGVAVGVYVIRKFGLRPSSRFRSRMLGPDMTSTATLGFGAASPKGLGPNEEEDRTISRNNTVVMQEEHIYGPTPATIAIVPSSIPPVPTQYYTTQESQPQYTYYEHDGYYYTGNGQQMYYQDGYYPQDYYLQPQDNMGIVQTGDQALGNGSSIPPSAILRAPGGPTPADDQAVSAARME